MAYDTEVDGKTYRVEGASSQGEAYQAARDHANNTYLTDIATGSMNADAQAARDRARAEEDAAEARREAEAAARERYYEIKKEADKLFKAGQFEQASKVYLSINEIGLAGYMYFKKGDNAKALSIWGNDKFKAPVYRCELYVAIGDYEKATEDCLLLVTGYADTGIIDNHEKMVFDTLKTAAEKGITRAYYGLGLCFYYGADLKKPKKSGVEGYGVKGDLTKAREWLEKSAETGDIEGVLALGVFNYYGAGGLKRDKKKGKEYIQKASKDQKTASLAKEWLRVIFMRDILGFKGYGEATPAGLTIIFTIILWFFGFMAISAITGTMNFWIVMIPLVVIIFSVAWRHRVLLLLELVLCVSGAFLSIGEAMGNEKIIALINQNKAKQAEAAQTVKELATPVYGIIASKYTWIGVRAEPSEDSEQIAKIPKGVFFNIIATQGKFTQVEYQGVQGWVGNDAVKKLNKNRIATTIKPNYFPYKYVRFAKGPAKDAEGILNLPKGRKVTLLGENVDGFIKVEYKGQEGWIDCIFLKW